MWPQNQIVVHCMLLKFKQVLCVWIECTVNTWLTTAFMLTCMRLQMALLAPPLLKDVNLFYLSRPVLKLQLLGHLARSPLLVLRLFLVGTCSVMWFGVGELVLGALMQNAAFGRTIMFLQPQRTALDYQITLQWCALLDGKGKNGIRSDLKIRSEFMRYSRCYLLNYLFVKSLLCAWKHAANSCFIGSQQTLPRHQQVWHMKLYLKPLKIGQHQKCLKRNRLSSAFPL